MGRSLSGYLLAGLHGDLHVLAARLSGFAMLLQVGARAVIIGLAPRTTRALLLLSGLIFAAEGLVVAASGAFTGALAFAPVLELATQVDVLRTA